MEFKKKIENKYATLAMSNLRPSDTGIPGVVLWISAGEFEGKGSQHAPRIKVIVGGGKVSAEDLRDAPSVTIKDQRVVRGSLSGKILKQVIKFILLNQEVLLKYWDQSISTAEMIKSIRGVE